MRESFRNAQLMGEDPTKFCNVPEHLGLAHDVLVPVETSGDDVGKLKTEFRDAWFQKLQGIKITKDYRCFYDRWVESFAREQVIAREVKSSGRLLVGVGNPSPIEFGLTLHHVWGVPMIPGSSIKGLIANYLAANYGPAQNSDPWDASNPEPERLRFQGPVWDGGHLTHPPGDVYAAIFGAPEAGDHIRFPVDWDEWKVGKRGEVIFFDALLVPPRGEKDFENRLAKDIVTVHQREYYQGKGAVSPNEWEEPNPIGFLSVKPNTRFLFAFDAPPAMREIVLQLLREALHEWGVGSKTAAGYGHFSETDSGWKSSPKLFEELGYEIRKPAWMHETSKHDWEGLSLEMQRWFASLEQGSKDFDELKAMTEAIGWWKAGGKKTPLWNLLCLGFRHVAKGKKVFEEFEKYCYPPPPPGKNLFIQAFVKNIDKDKLFEEGWEPLRDRAFSKNQKKDERVQKLLAQKEESDFEENVFWGEWARALQRKAQQANWKRNRKEIFNKIKSLSKTLPKLKES